MSRAVPSLFVAAFLTVASPLAFESEQQAVVVSDADWCEDSGSNPDRERFCEVREVSIASSGGVTIRDNANGGIEVSGSSRDDVRVRARIVATARTMDEARSLASQVEVRANGGEVQASGPRTSGRDQSWSASFRIDAPTRVDLDLSTSNGSIQVAGVSGRIRTESSNGSLRLQDVGGDVVGRTSNGSVQVDLGGETWQGTGLDVQTSNGSARINVPEDYNARLVAGTSNGRLSVDFPVTVQGNLRGSIDVPLGSGGSTIRIESSNGSVRIGRR